MRFGLKVWVSNSRLWRKKMIKWFTNLDSTSVPNASEIKTRLQSAYGSRILGQYQTQNYQDCANRLIIVSVKLAESLDEPVCLIWYQWYLINTVYTVYSIWYSTGEAFWSDTETLSLWPSIKLHMRDCEKDHKWTETIIQ